jgi:hypothetical protein
VRKEQRTGLGNGDEEGNGDILTWYGSEKCENDNEIFEADSSGRKRMSDYPTSLVGSSMVVDQI